MNTEHVQAWVDEALPGETVLAWMHTAPTTGRLDTGGDLSGRVYADHVQDHVRQRGLPADQRVGLLTRFVLVLTDRSLAGVQLGGLRPRPKHLLFSHPATGATCEWWDAADGLATWRNLVVFLDDGRWLGCATAIRSVGKVPSAAARSAELLAALGDHAVEIDPWDPPAVPGTVVQRVRSRST